MILRIKQLKLSKRQLATVKGLAEWSSVDHTEGRILLRLVEDLESGATVLISLK